MIKVVSKWFMARTVSQKSNSMHTVELATAVLLYEIMRADEALSDDEIDVFQHRLQRHFSLPADELSELKSLAKKQVDDASDFVQFTRIINDQCSHKQKREILDSLWLIAFSDGKLDPHEEHLIRRISDLLYLPHSQFIQSKLAAQTD